MDHKSEIGQLGAGRVRSSTPTRNGGRKIGNRPAFHKIMLETSATKAPLNLRLKAEIERKARDPETQENQPGTIATGLVPLTALLAPPVTGDGVKTAQPLNKENTQEIAEVRRGGEPRHADDGVSVKTEQSSPQSKAAVIAVAPKLKAEIPEPMINEENEADHANSSPLKTAPETIDYRSWHLGTRSAQEPARPPVLAAEVLTAGLGSSKKVAAESSYPEEQPIETAVQPAMKKPRVEAGLPTKNSSSAAIASVSRIVEGLTNNGKKSAGEGAEDRTTGAPPAATAKPDLAAHSSPASTMALNASPALQIADFVAEAVSPPALPMDPERVRMSHDAQMRTLELVLHPETIGRVRVSLYLRGQSLGVKIEAKSAETARVIEQDRSLLGRLLSEAGFQLSAADIRVEVQAPARDPAAQEQSAYQPGRAMSEGDRGQSGSSHDAESTFSASETRNESGDKSSLQDRAGDSRSGVYV